MEENNLDELEILLDTCPYLTWIKDTEDRLVYVNKIYADMLEKSKEEIIGKKEQELWGITLGQGRIYSQDKKVHLEVHEMDLYEDNDIVGKKGIAKDITIDINIIRQFEMAYNNIMERVAITSERDGYKKLINKFQEVGKELFENLKGSSIIVVLEDEIIKQYSIVYNEGFTLDEQEVIKRYIKNTEAYKLVCQSITVGDIKGINHLENEEYRKLLDYKGIKKIVRYPIAFNDKLLGVVIVYNPQIIPDFHMSTISIYMGITIKSLMLFEHTMGQIKQRIEAEEELQIFFEKSNQIMISIDKEKNIKVIGTKATEILGWDNSEICDYIKQDIYIESYLKRVKQDYNRVLEAEKKCPCKDGSYKDIKWYLKYRSDKDMVIIIGEDITKKKQEEAEDLRLQVEMELEYIKGELLSCMSNEFKTPVNTILYTIELLQDKIKSNQVQVSSHIDLEKYMGLIKQNAYRLIRLINNLVDSNSIESGEYSLNLGTHNIVQIIMDIMRSVEDYIRTKGVRLNFITVTDEALIVCDPDKIERIMLNLISNAIKYTDEGGQITIELKQDPKYIFIHVSDDGEGIDEGKLEAIFERFSQGDNGLTRKREGSGIGLSLVKALVQMHEGEIEVSSQIGIGTEFIVKLPRIKILKNEKREESKYSVNNNTEVWHIEFADIYE